MYAREFLNVLKSPFQILAIVLFIYGFLPLLAFGLGSLLFPNHPEITAGVGSDCRLPVAMTSAFWTDLAKEQPSSNLSIITLTTFLAGLVTPGVMGVMAGQLVEFDAQALVVKLIKTVIIPYHWPVVSPEIPCNNEKPNPT